MKIRKLYNVLVIGGIAAAGCTKDSKDPPKADPAKTEPVKAADPAKAETPPAAVKPVDTVAKPADPAPAAAPEPVEKKDDAAAAKAKTVKRTQAAQPTGTKAADADKGSGVKGWS